MKIDFLSFLHPFHYGGGGEMIIRNLIDSGRAAGHDIRISSMRPPRLRRHSSSDLSMLVDIHNTGYSLRSGGAWRRIPRRVLSSFVDSTPYVHINTAYADVCNLPYLPCSGIRNHSACEADFELPLADALIARHAKGVCFGGSDAIRALHRKASMNVFLSPLHLSVSEKILGGSIPNPFVLKPTVDAELFSLPRRERDIDYLFVGALGEAKGLDEMRKRFKDKALVMVGHLTRGTSLDFGTYLGARSYSEVAELMARSKNFVFLPRWPEPQGRVVVEAALSGCNLICNDNVGALSFGFDLADPSNFEGAADEFWRAVTIKGTSACPH